MKYFKLSEIKSDSTYAVYITDNENGTTTTEKMPGAQLVTFAQASAHLYDIRAEEVDENREYCKRIADELEAIYNGHGVTEDGEQATLYDWINDSLDFEYTIDSGRRYKSAKIWVALSGPNVWIDTAEKSVKLAWANERAELCIPYDVCDAIDEIMSELWNMY